MMLSLPATVVLASAVVLLVVLSTLVLCLKRDDASKRARSAETDQKKRNRQRVKEEEEERGRAIALVVDFIEKGGKYQIVNSRLHNLGGRLQKYWMEIRPLQGSTQEKLILTMAPMSKSCGLQLNEDETVLTLNSLFQELNKHPCVHRVEDLFYIPEGNLVVLVQPAIMGGSLKDIIWRQGQESDSTGFDISWSEKGYDTGVPLGKDQVVEFGRQIMKGLRYFREVNFPTLTHVHTGNIFVVDGVCLIGGHENTLLGYKSRLYKTCVQKNCVEYIDIIMFGHVLFEMSAGLEASEYIPTKKDYELVKDDHLKKVLKFIFAESKDRKKFKHSLDEIYKKYFKKGTFKIKNTTFKREDVNITEAMKDLLQRVKEN